MDVTFAYLFDLMLAHWHITFIGVFVGILIGATPGLTSSNSTAIMLPFILTLSPATGIIFVISMHAGAQMGNSFPAVLLNIPGTPSAVVTTMEGYPMAVRGEASRALGICIFASVAGALIGGLVSLLTIPYLASVALKFSPVELTIVVLFGIVIIGQISSGGVWKGLLSGFFGLMVATSGPDPMWSQYRGSFGIVYLYDGIPIISCLVGLLAFSEVFNIIANMEKKSELLQQKISFRGMLRGMKDVLVRPVEMLRSAAIGLIVGAIPGAGASVATPIAYQQSMSFSSKEDRKMFGKGSVNGLMAADVTNNAMIGGAMIPLLTLALPGSSTDAILLVALSYHGLAMGPQFISLNGDLAYAALISQFAAAFFIAICGLFLAYIMARVVNIRMAILIPIIAVLSFIGGFAETQLTFGIWVMVVSGIIGFYMKKYKYVPLAFVLGLVLGGKFEANLFRGYRLGHNSFSIFFESNIAIALWILLALTIFLPILRGLWVKRKARLENGGA